MLHKRGVNLQNINHCFNSLLTLAVVAWAGIHHHVVFAHSHVVHDGIYTLRVLFGFVDVYQVGLSIISNDSHYPLAVVNLGD